MANHLIGFLGGTFDPIHSGHLNLALEIAERRGLDNVLFCPTQVSPFKQNCPPNVSTTHRMEMVKLAIKPIEGFELCDLEVNREGPSYTIDTLAQLHEENPEAQFHLILGGDLARGLLKWKDAGELLKLAPPLIGARQGSAIEVDAEVIFLPVFDISSTTVRDRLQRGLYCGHLLPQAVLDYISFHGLYSSGNGG